MGVVLRRTPGLRYSRVHRRTLDVGDGGTSMAWEPLGVAVTPSEGVEPSVGS